MKRVPTKRKPDVAVRIWKSLDRRLCAISGSAWAPRIWWAADKAEILAAIREELDRAKEGKKR
jgi:hypothetical protein